MGDIIYSNKITVPCVVPEKAILVLVKNIISEVKNVEAMNASDNKLFIFVSDGNDRYVVIKMWKDILNLHVEVMGSNMDRVSELSGMIYGWVHSEVGVVCNGGDD